MKEYRKFSENFRVQFFRDFFSDVHRNYCNQGYCNSFAPPDHGPLLIKNNKQLFHEKNFFILNEYYFS